MAKGEEGIVVEVKDQFAFLKAIRHSSCKSCGACPGDNATIIKAFNKARAKEDDLVYFKMNETAMLKATFIVFVLPLVLTFAGVWFIPYAMETWLKIQHSTLNSILGGAIGFAVGAVGIKMADRYFGGLSGNLPIVTSIKEKKEV